MGWQMGQIGMQFLPEILHKLPDRIPHIGHQGITGILHIRIENYTRGAGFCVQLDESVVGYNRCNLTSRGVAQPGSAPALGAGGPRFKSARPDQLTLCYLTRIAGCFDAVSPSLQFNSVPSFVPTQPGHGRQDCILRRVNVTAGDRD